MMNISKSVEENSGPVRYDPSPAGTADLGTNRMLAVREVVHFFVLGRLAGPVFTLLVQFRPDHFSSR